MSQQQHVQNIKYTIQIKLNHSTACHSHRPPSSVFRHYHWVLETIYHYEGAHFSLRLLGMEELCALFVRGQESFDPKLQNVKENHARGKMGWLFVFLIKISFKFTHLTYIICSLLISVNGTSWHCLTPKPMPWHAKSVKKWEQSERVIWHNFTRDMCYGMQLPWTMWRQ
jgi:hypothetical protein